MNFTSEQNITVSGDTVSVVLDVLGDTSKVELWGYAVEYTTTVGAETNEWWGDWAPNEKFPHYGETGGTDDTDDTDDPDGSDSKTGTPGFELVVVLAAVAVALIILRKRR